MKQKIPAVPFRTYSSSIFSMLPVRMEIVSLFLLKGCDRIGRASDLPEIPLGDDLIFFVVAKFILFAFV